MSMKIIASALVVTAVLSGGMLYHGHHVDMDNVRSERAMNARTRKTNDKTADLSVASMKDDYDAEYPNLDKATSKNTGDVNKAMKLAFSDSTTSSEYNGNKNKITDLLGSSVGDKVLSIVKPQISQNSSKPQSIAGKLTGCEVGYGRFDTFAKAVPVNIVVQFDTVPIDPEAGNSPYASHKKVVSHELVVLDGYLSTSNNTMTLSHERDTLDQNND